MVSHPDRVRPHYDQNDIQTVGIMTVQDKTYSPTPEPDPTFAMDVRLLLDYLGVQYLDPDVNAAMHRVRKVVGYHT